MVLDNNIQVFNLWNTNGRRADVLNAIEIYLNILADLREEDPNMIWGKYPTSLSQFSFYQKAIEASPEVFKEHGKYDQFVEAVPIKDLESGIELSRDQKRNLDQNIEMRARHYTSNLVRLGLATDNREITPAGKAYHNEQINRDAIEDILPIATTNLLLLRQLLKLRVYTLPDEDTGERMSYSPFYMALYILLSGVRFDKDDFKTIIQSLTPYNPIEPDMVIEECRKKRYSFAEREIMTPPAFKNKEVVGQTEFESHIKNTKSGKALIYYYEFYKKLFDYYHKRSDLKYETLKEVCIDDPAKLRQAFGSGQKVFDFGRQNSYDHEEFKEHNADSSFLITKDFNETFFREHIRSKIIDQARENADTTARLFSATGLISLGKALPQLIDEDIYEIVFDKEYLKNNVFKKVSKKEYDAQQEAFESNVSLCRILGYSEETINAIIKRIAKKLGRDAASIRDALTDRTSIAFVNFVEEYYPRERVSKLLRGFSLPDGGISSRDEINPSCGIPTAYEYIVAIAWHYISDEYYNLYESMNLTMGADFEPERFAPGGTGDIIAEYENSIVMLEVTMMNAQAQKRGEWEPVLRHSVNLRVDSAPKDTVTFFIANELDYNTINIWRAVAVVPLKSSNSETVVTGVDIMPLTNDELSDIMDEKIGSNQLIAAIKASYSNLDRSFDEAWRDSILSEARAV